ncbi:hypothetical protein DFQ27_005164 [Actinomortierella ambigua]|uniref:polynucleotide adenylyltransferase n=1 Tax=Actinomortierella ambigua TaxID=1343610 RepID=A0A9P6U3B1_9FUNG|nr:hypothetical protein DFQ27_005164 [Actinomortierella ambigua]
MSAGAANAHSKSTETSTTTTTTTTATTSASPHHHSPLALTAAAGPATQLKFDGRASMTISHPEPHRPDSPTSLEDSQSESGLDSFYIPVSAGSSTLTLADGIDDTSSSSLASSLSSSASVSDLMNSSSSQPRHCPKAAHAFSSSSSSLSSADHATLASSDSTDLGTAGPFDRNMTIHTDLTMSSPMSPSQVATPPLSPTLEQDETIGIHGASPDLKGSRSRIVEDQPSQDQEVQEKEATLPNGSAASAQEPPRRSADSAVDHQQQRPQPRHPSPQRQRDRQVIGQTEQDTPPSSTLKPSAAVLIAAPAAGDAAAVATADATQTKGPSVAAAHSKTASGHPARTHVAAPKAAVPPMSAWANLLPGVAPAPVLQSPASVQPPSKPKSSSPSYSRSTLNDRRIHDLIPIVLPHDSEAKLTMEMIDLFETLLPTEESHARRTQLIHKIKAIMDAEWPGEDILVHPFGSTENDLGTSSSDVDLCITTPLNSQLKSVQQLATAFRRHGMQRVFCVPRAKVPIVKLWDADLHLSCDMNINNPLALVNTRMIKTYVAIDPRVRPFAMIIKHWARRRVLNDAANGGTISTYTWICIVINFLQMRSPPILPALHKMPHTLAADNQVINGNNTSFCEDLAQLEGFGLANKETLGGLLYAFFRRYAIEYDYDHHVISVREGSYLTKESKNWHIPGKQYKLLCVEEPIDTTRNLGNSSDMASTKGLREEFRRALDILHQRGSLHQVCQQWVFPPSYYHNVPRKGHYNPNNYTPGRRYTYGYRSHNYYDDDHYYDDDDDEEDDDDDDFPVMPQRDSQHNGSNNSSASVKDKVTALLGITFKKRSNSMSSTGMSGHSGSGSAHHNSNKGNTTSHSSSNGTKSTSTMKDRSTTRTRRSSSASSVTGEVSGDGKSSSSTGRTRASRAHAGGEEAVANGSSSSKPHPTASGSSLLASLSSSAPTRSANGGHRSGEKSSSGSGSGRTSRRQKSGEGSSSSTNNSGSGRRSGGGGNNSGGGSGNSGGNSNGSHRAPRAMVEFNLAEIASAAPKWMSRARGEATTTTTTTPSKCSEATKAGSGSAGEEGLAGTDTSGTMTTMTSGCSNGGSSCGGGGGGGTSGSEGGSSVRGKKQKQRRHQNVVWSTNSNRGCETLSSRSNGCGARNGSQQASGVETEKAKPIFVVAGDDIVGIPRPLATLPPPPSSSDSSATATLATAPTAAVASTLADSA